MTTPAAARGPGRPRIYPTATTGADRKALSRRATAHAGGHRVDVELGPRAWRALQKLAPKGERGPLIEDLVLAELARRGLPVD